MFFENFPSDTRSKTNIGDDNRNIECIASNHAIDTTCISQYPQQECYYTQYIQFYKQTSVYASESDGVRYQNHYNKQIQRQSYQYYNQVSQFSESFVKHQLKFDTNQSLVQQKQLFVGNTVENPSIVIPTTMVLQENLVSYVPFFSR